MTDTTTLDREVAEALGFPYNSKTGRIRFEGVDGELPRWEDFSPTTNWGQCGKLIEEYEIELYVAVHSCEGDISWNATYYFETEEKGEPVDGYGATPQEAVCRAIVAALTAKEDK